MVKFTPRKCGTCHHWTGNPKSSAIARCAYPVPAPPVVPEAFAAIIDANWQAGRPHSQGVDRQDGGGCPCWSLRAA